MKSGDGINFDALFAAVLPNEDDRTTLFTEFANNPGVLEDGWIDLDQRQIYRYSQRWTTQLFSSAILVLALLLTGLAVANAWRMSTVIPGWILDRSSSGTVFGAWLAALAGVGFHMMIDSAKSAQAQGQKAPNMSLRQVPLWIEVHLGTLLAKLLLTLVALFAVAFYVGVRSLTPLYGLLVGYSLDSVLGLIQDSVGQQSSAFIAMLKQKTGASTS